MFKKQLYPQPVASSLALTGPKRNLSLNWRRWLIRLGGTGLLLFLVWRINLNLGQIVTELFHAQWQPLLLSVLLIFPILSLKTWRWCLMLRSLGIQLPYRAAYKLYALGLATGSFTPGQVGDTIKAWYLRDMGYQTSLALISIVYDRLFDLALLALLATSGVLVLGSGFASELPALLALLAGIALALIVVVVPALRFRLIGLVSKIVARKNVKEVAFQEAKTVTGATGEVRAGQSTQLAGLLQPLLLTLLTSGLNLVRVWLLAQAVSLPLNFIEAVAVSSLATVASLIPISVSGIGVRDLTLIGILGKLGYARESAISLSALILLLNLVNLVLGYAIWSARKPVSAVSLPKD